MSGTAVERDEQPHLPVLSGEGLFVFQRRSLARSDYELVPVDGGLMVKLMIDKQDTELVEATSFGALSVKLA